MWKLIPAGVAGLALLAGCGSSSKAASPPSTTGAPVNYGAKYQDIINRVDADFKAVPASPQAGQLIPLEGDVERAQAQLLAVSWPPTAKTEVRTVVTDLGTLAGDIEADNGPAFEQEASVVSTTSATIRTDLGLPSNPG